MCLPAVKDAVVVKNALCHLYPMGQKDGLNEQAKILLANLLTEVNIAFLWFSRDVSLKEWH